MAPAAGSRGGNASNQTVSAQTAPPVPDGPAPASTPPTNPEANRVKELEAEVEQLRGQLAEAQQPKTSEGDEPAYVTALVDALADGKPLTFDDAEVPEDVERRLRAAGRLTNRPVEPSFGLSEGQRQELVATGKTVSPFTGTPQLGTGKPGAKPRAVSAEEHAKTPAKQQAPARGNKQ
ncbi:hypothetical protein AB0J68_01460 [Micromonospora sp. NPDC049580]|uniref:hypothetical protein n=1 Tax=Micromonospora sp. NPDC049580 TaxID=3154832 RepID=UPI0034325ABD